MAHARKRAGAGAKRPLAGFIGVAVAVVGVGTYLTGSAQRQATSAVVAGNLPVNSGAVDPNDISANNSPTLARNPVRPTSLAVVNRVDAPRFSCALHVSGDGGATWRERAIPFPAGEEDPQRCYAPDAAFGTDGTLYLTFVTLQGPGNVPNAVWIVSSPPGSRTFGDPVRIAGPLAFQVRLLVDPRAPGRLHVTWLQAEGVALYAFPTTGNPIVSARSDDGGTTWGEPVRVSPPSREGGSTSCRLRRWDVVRGLPRPGRRPARLRRAHEGKGGDPYDGSWTLVVARSKDGGSWEEAEVDASVVPAERFVVFLPPLPSVAFDARHRRLHVAFQDARSGDADVHLWSSGDGGRTFDGPRRVNDDAGAAGTSQYMAQLGVAPGGRLDALYFDRRADPTDRRNEVSLQSSSDGGRSFGPRLRVSDGAFDSRIGFGQQRGLPDQGNRLGLVSTDRRALAVWTDTRSADPRLMEQDLARAVISFSAGSSLRGVLHGLGATLGAGGLLVALLSLLAHRRHDESGDEREGSGDEDDTGVPAAPGLCEEML